MKVIGITGGTGAGKTTALNELRQLGAYIIDCDIIYHELLENSWEMINEINKKFPDAFFDGKLDRKKLGSIVFCDPAALSDLNKITHKYVCEDVKMRLENEKSRGAACVAVDAIALLESDIAGLCDVVVGVTAPVEARISRIMARDNIAREHALLRLRAQHDDEYFKSKCDYVLNNDGNNPAAFAESCKKLFIQICGGCGNGGNK